jgi:hypothetical protein
MAAIVTTRGRAGMPGPEAWNGTQGRVKKAKYHG